MSSHIWIPPHTIHLASVSFCSQDFAFYIKGKHCYFKELTTSVFRSSSYSVHSPPPHSQILLFWLLSSVVLSIMYFIKPKSTAVLRTNCAGSAAPKCEQTASSGFACYQLALRGNVVPAKHLSCSWLWWQIALDPQWLSMGSVWQFLLGNLSLLLLLSLVSCSRSFLQLALFTVSMHH